MRDAGLRSTRQRLALTAWLFDGCHKHVTPEQLHTAMNKKRVNLSLATVYNSLNRFTAIGLLRQVVIGGGQIYFDTNTSDHHHMFDESTGALTDIAGDAIHITSLPTVPSGRKLARVEVILRVQDTSA